MLKMEKTAVMNLENAIRGARNPMNSWARSDSYYNEAHDYILGPKDLELAQKLCRSGSDHRKFIRQIFVSVDITAPLYWWKEYDTYKVGTTANSTSTMHRIHSKPFSIEDFSCERLTPPSRKKMEEFLEYLENVRLAYVQTKDRALWTDLIQLLPSSYQQTRTCTMNYENLVNMFHARKNHKLEEWHVFCQWIQTLPYARELILLEEDGGLCGNG